MELLMQQTESEQWKNDPTELLITGNSNINNQKGQLE